MDPRLGKENKEHECILIADCFRIVIKPLYITRRDITFTRTRIEFALVSSHPRYGDLSTTNEGALIEIRELERLLNYLKNHIQKLKDDIDYVSFPYVDGYGLNFKLQALSGPIDEDEKVGGFSISFMIPIRLGPEKKRLWIGVEGGVELADVKQFISSLEAAICEIKQPDS